VHRAQLRRQYSNRDDSATIDATVSGHLWRDNRYQRVDCNKNQLLILKSVFNAANFVMNLKESGGFPNSMQMAHIFLMFLLALARRFFESYGRENFPIVPETFL
jgi:hypothetical protein